MKLKSHSGTYVLVLESQRQDTLAIGRTKTLVLQKGFYLYVGSAFGPGGVQARVGHHMTPSANPHWHIDYLKQAIPITRIWYAYHRIRREHQWADILQTFPHASIPLKKFGASDCDCEAHLFFFPRLPSVRQFRLTLKQQISEKESLGVVKVGFGTK